MNMMQVTGLPAAARWRIAGGAAIVMVLGSLLPAAAAESPAAVIDLPEGGFLPGHLAPADAGQPMTTLLWQSSLFAEPVEFAIDGIERVRFPKAKAAAPQADAWRAELAGDNALVGTLQSIDADHVVLDVPDVGQGPIRLRRDQVARLSRLVSGQVGQDVILPGPIAGWDAERAAWQEVAGRLACRTPGQAASRGLPVPARVCFEIVLAWDDRPDLEIRLAGRQADAESYRLEALAGDLIAVREGKAATLDRIAVLPAGPGSVRVLVFIDQKLGRMAVLLPDADGEPAVAFDEAIPPRKEGVQGGFGILLRSGDVRIDRLRVSPWQDDEPKPTAAADLGGPAAAVESFDKATASFTVRAAAGPRQVAAAEVSEVLLGTPDASQPPPAPGTMTAVLHGGGRLVGRIVEVTPESIRLECPAVVDPVTCNLRSLAALESVAERRAMKLPGLPGVLETDQARLPGCLANAAVPGTGITWLPRGGVRPVGIVAAARGVRIVYPARDQARADAPADEGSAILYFKTGDSINCEVLAAGPEGLRIRTPVVPDLLVPPLILRAVELLPAAAITMVKTNRERLLTLPRSQQSDPPTHLLRLTSGDYLRGKLVSLDDLSVTIEVAGVSKQLPRSAVARLIWLSIEGDDSEAEAMEAMSAGAADGVPLRATMHDGRRLTMAATGVEGDQLVGERGVLGRLAVALDQCGRIDLWPASDTTSVKDLPFGQWKLRPAALPRALRDDPKPDNPAPPTGLPAGPAHPLAGKVLVVPVVELLEPAAGREKLTPQQLEGKVGVLAIFGQADAPVVAALRQLQEAVGSLPIDDVAFVAVAERADREVVAQAVAGLVPRPPVALDTAGILQSRLGKDALPVCLILDREGCVADVVSLAPETIDGLRARVVELAARTRQKGAEFRAFAKAREAALAEDRGCLDPLGKLLDAESEFVRRRSIGLLRQLTGLAPSAMPFKLDAVGAERESQVRRWRQWLAVNGISADLSFPRKTAGAWADARPIVGRTLICVSGRVVEIDEEGNQVFKVKVGGPWACDITSEKHRLVGDHQGRAVIEYDEQGKEVWAIRNLPGGPMSVRRLENGNTLVALSDANLVAEYDPQGKIVWSAKVAGRPCDARRLPDGHTLVAAHRANRIIELDAGGEEVWAVEEIEDPQTVQRLPDGRTLVAMSVPGVVREIDRDGRTVWERQGFKTPVDVQRLPDGTTLVQEQAGDLIELDAVGTEVGRQRTAGNRFLRW